MYWYVPDMHFTDFIFGRRIFPFQNNGAGRQFLSAAPYPPTGQGAGGAVNVGWLCYYQKSYLSCDTMFTHFCFSTLGAG